MRQTAGSEEDVESGEMLIHLAHVDALSAAGDRDGARTAAITARARLTALAGAIGDPALRARYLAVAESARFRALADALAPP